MLGAKAAKVLVAQFLLVESDLLFHSFQNAPLGAGLAAVALWFLLDAFVLWQERPYPLSQMRFFLIGWVPLTSMVWATAALRYVR